MRADIYQKLYEFNQHTELAVAALRELAQMKSVRVARVEHIVDYFEEIRSDASGYPASLLSEQEDRESGRLFVQRRRRDMAEDPMHGGWLEEEREKKKEKRGARPRSQTRAFVD
ncbi:MAG TPA: hypothetical protein VIB39_22455 [Candidatus Angelobacter sp.]|jgi:hypothetical protein